MGMPVAVEIADTGIAEELFEEVFAYFTYVDEKFSTYKKTSEISAINRGEIPQEKHSEDMKLVFALSEETKKLTRGYFDIVARDGRYDPSGLVKGWAIHNAAKLLKERGIKNFYIDVGGDVEVSGRGSEGGLWRIGIQNPLGKKEEIVKVLSVVDAGVATSGISFQKHHIYNPVDKDALLDEIVSLTVIGPNAYEADRFATSAFAMGRAGIEFIERLEEFEGYQIDKDGVATMTSGFNNYVAEPDA